MYVCKINANFRDFEEAFHLYHLVFLMGKIWSLGYTSVYVYVYVCYINLGNVCLLCSGDAKFRCPQTASYYPAEVFSCQEKIYTALLNQASNVH